MQLFLQSELTVTAYIAVRSSIRYVRSKTPRDSEMLPPSRAMQKGKKKNEKKLSEIPRGIKSSRQSSKNAIPPGL